MSGGYYNYTGNNLLDMIEQINREIDPSPIDPEDPWRVVKEPSEHAERAKMANFLVKVVNAINDLDRYDSSDTSDFGEVVDAFKRCNYEDMPQPVPQPRCCPVCFKRGKACKCGLCEQAAKTLVWLKYEDSGS